MKIFVTGNAGSGKSTMGREIARQRGLDYYSLDKIVWQSGWKKTPAAEQKVQIAELLQKDGWVIDGVDYDILVAADHVIFLDIPRRVCLWRALMRNRRYLFKSRPELPENCPEILIIPQLIKIIWRFPKRVRPKILYEKSRRPAAFTHLKTPHDHSSYLSRI